jgi:VWFA-related protein
MRIAAVASALTLLAALAYAETRTTLTSPHQPPSDSGLTLHVTTRETVVDVTVTDSHGNPIHGLTRDDFTIKEDGKPQSLRSFNEYGSPTVTPTSASLPKLPPHVYTNLQPPANDGPINILLLDETNTAPDIGGMCPSDPADGRLCLNQATEIQHLMRQEVIKYIQAIPAGTRVVLLAAIRDHLRFLQGLTSDHELLIASVNTLDSETDVIPKGFDFLNDIASIASGIKGRKNLLWFTSGTARYTEPEKCHCDTTPFLRAASQLTEAQVTIYPIDARGAYYIENKNDPLGITARALAGEALSQETIAEAGGGIAYHDSNDLKTGIARAIDAGSHYYTLSYATPDKEYDGRHHSISVKLNTDHPGLHLTYRDYYYSDDPATTLPKPQFSLLPEPASTGNMVAAMSRSMPISTALLFDAQIEPSTEPAKSTDPAIFGVLDVKYKAKPLTRYGVVFALPARQIAFAPGPNNTHRGGLEFDLAAYDADGKLINSLSQTLQLPLSDSTFQQMQKGPFRFFQQLDLPPGEVFLRIGIRDLTSNKIGTLEVPLTVPKTPPDRAAATTPAK